jgi:hypothetical protein
MTLSAHQFLDSIYRVFRLTPPDAEPNDFAGPAWGYNTLLQNMADRLSEFDFLLVEEALEKWAFSTDVDGQAPMQACGVEWYFESKEHLFWVRNEDELKAAIVAAREEQP